MAENSTKERVARAWCNADLKRHGTACVFPKCRDEGDCLDVIDCAHAAIEAMQEPTAQAPDRNATLEEAAAACEGKLTVLTGLESVFGYARLEAHNIAIVDCASTIRGLKK